MRVPPLKAPLKGGSDGLVKPFSFRLHRRSKVKSKDLRYHTFVSLSQLAIIIRLGIAGYFKASI